MSLLNPKLLGVLLVTVAAASAGAYDGRDHQFFTFLAAKQFNRCVEDTEIPTLTPLQVRYMARANAGLADRSVLARMFNWRYYDRADQSEHSFLWIVNTRFHDHYNELSDRMVTDKDPVTAYQDLGRILSYIQLVTSPARVVPVYTARFWRFSFGDRFDGYPVDEAALSALMEGDCGFLEEIPNSYEAVLEDTANKTLAAVGAPIDGLPTRWTAFWMPSSDPGGFGDYGPAGNSFGRRTEFRCGDDQRCVLLQDDPLYREFALARQRDAVVGTQAAMLLMQMSLRDTVASAR
ncbi:MAG: hypothetical protein PVH91_04380 [Pseudomonadales bacterium]